jgi:hypothetical protein
MSNDGTLSFSGVTQNAIYNAKFINGNQNQLSLQRREIKLIAQHNSSLIWPDTFSIDDEGKYLWVTPRGWPITKQITLKI